MKYPKVYLLRKTNDKYEIYLGTYSTLEGIRLLNKNTKIKIEEFGATNYKKIGFATENDIPEINTIEEFIAFLENDNNITIINCKIELNEIGQLSIYDDSECRFIANTKDIAFDLIKKALPEIHQPKVLAELIQNPDKFITLDHSTGKTAIYFTIDDYRKNHDSIV